MILITGGLGYIGSHLAIELIKQGYQIVIFDNISTKDNQNRSHINKICNCIVPYYNVNLLDKEKLNRLFSIFTGSNKIDLVIHLAGRKSVPESVKEPLLYYQNLTMTINLIEVMIENNVKNLIFSSSGTVYSTNGNSNNGSNDNSNNGSNDSNGSTGFKEDSQTGISLSNPYAKSKFFIEELLKDLYNSDNSWNITILRYFNPAGFHESRLITENSSNLFPQLIKDPNNFKIYGNDFKTTDGTAIRDYIHIRDLVSGHIICLPLKGLHIYNLGSGTGYSVKQVLDTFKRVKGVEFDYQYVDRREGDIDAMVADITKIREELGWTLQYSLEDICKDV